MEQVKGVQNRSSGQAVTEYILLLAVLISIFSLILNLLGKTDVIANLKKPLEKDFAFTYRYGHPQARGQNDGGPKYIPQQHDPDQNFRIFVNPPIKE